MGKHELLLAIIKITDLLRRISGSLSERISEIH